MRSPLWSGHFRFFAIGYLFLLSIPLLSSFSFSFLIHLPLFVESFHLVQPRQPQSIIALFSFFIFWSASSRPSIRLPTGAFPTQHSGFRLRSRVTLGAIRLVIIMSYRRR